MSAIFINSSELRMGPGRHSGLRRDGGKDAWAGAATTGAAGMWCIL
jgi:hypothetical protein